MFTVILLFSFLLKCVLEMPIQFSSEFKDLLKRIFRKNPGERPTIDELMQHQWFANSKSNSFSDLKENSLFSKITNL